jgi:hypothetical protein
MISPIFFPERMVILEAASCRRIQASVEKSRTHIRSKLNIAPDPAAVVIVPGPINAADTTDQKSIFRRLWRIFI